MGSSSDQLLIPPRPWLAVSRSWEQWFVMTGQTKYNGQLVAPQEPRISKITCLGWLCLLRLLLLLGLLRLRNSLLSCSSSHCLGLVSLSQDTLQVGTNTNDTTLVLNGLARTLLGHFFCDTLLVHSSEDLCPSDLAWVFALEEKGFIL